MKLVLLAAFFVAILLQNEVSAKRNKYQERTTDDNDQGHLDAKEGIDIDQDAGNLAEFENDDMMEEKRDALKKSPELYWTYRRRCTTFYRRRISYCQ